MEDIVNQTRAAVGRAGAILLTAADREQIMKKGPANFVTGVDLRVQEALIGELTAIIPGSNIITEESGENRYDFHQPTWVLDPVDGTTNLLHSFPYTAISLLLVLEGAPFLGIVYNPRLEEFFCGMAGQGATLNGERIRVSQNRPLAECLMGFGTAPYDRNQSEFVFRTAATVFKACCDFRRTGSAALDFSYVACGRMDGYFELCLQPWDFGAALLILQEAGGKMTDWEGNPPDLSRPQGILGTNGMVHEEMLELLRSVR